MFENIANFFKKLVKTEKKDAPSKETAKERLHLVLMQDRAHVSADFLELMKQEIIEVIKNRRAPSGKAYIEIARRVLGENIDVTIPGREKGLWAKIKGWFRKK
jgi:cell division topological specificity factor